MYNSRREEVSFKMYTMPPSQIFRLNYDKAVELSSEKTENDCKDSSVI